jgi:hypothetical protein
VNPLLDAFERAMTEPSGDVDTVREELIARYAFAVPTDDALEAIEAASPDGVIELGAGTGYWAGLLDDRGLSVEAFDIAPAPSQDNQWFAGSPSWYPVRPGDHTTPAAYPERTLLIVWPTRNETWAAAALDAYHEAGGQCVAYVGEGPGGHTGDDVFHARIGELSTCTQCVYGSTTSPCICSIRPQWRLIRTVPLPHWPGCEDDFRLYARDEPALRPSRRFDRLRRPRRGPRTESPVG